MEENPYVSPKNVKPREKGKPLLDLTSRELLRVLFFGGLIASVSFVLVALLVRWMLSGNAKL